MILELYTERLYLRPYQPCDVDLDIEMGTDSEVTKYMGGVETEEQIVAWTANFTRRCGGGSIGVWTVLDQLAGEKLGVTFLTPLPIDAEDTEWELIQGDGFPDGDIEIGYLFKRSAWGKGFATEACKRLLRFVFEETPLPEIVSVIEAENATSEKVLQKCGFASEGTRRAYAKQHSAFRITRKQWSEQEQVSS